MSEREICMDGIERMYADEVFDAVEAAAVDHETTWLTSGGMRLAAIVPADATRLVVIRRDDLRAVLNLSASQEVLNRLRAVMEASA